MVLEMAATWITLQFALPWNIENIFGMLEDPIATNKASRHFFGAKIG